MTLNIEICINVANWIHIVLSTYNRISFEIEMTTLAIVLQCPSWPNKDNIRIVVSFFLIIPLPLKFFNENNKKLRH